MKRIFIRGLFGALPIIATLAFILVDVFVVAKIALAIQHAIEGLVVSVSGVPRESLEAHPFWGWLLSWGGVVLAILLALLILIGAGAVLATRVGERLHQVALDRLARLPGGAAMAAISRTVHGRIEREVVHAKYDGVILVPIEGSSTYQIGIVTGKGGILPAEPDAHRVLLPGSPLSLASHLVFAPPNRAIRTDLPIDGAFRIIGSWGLIPPQQVAEPSAKAKG